MGVHVRREYGHEHTAISGTFREWGPDVRVPVMSAVVQAPFPSRGRGTKLPGGHVGVCFILLYTFLVVFYKTSPNVNSHTHTVSLPCSTPTGEAGMVRKVHTKCGKSHRRSRNWRRETISP